MKDLNHEDMLRAILFKIEVKDSYKDGGPRIHRTIEVIAETYNRAREVYYEQCGSYECEFVSSLMSPSPRTGTTVVLTAN